MTIQDIYNDPIIYQMRKGSNSNDPYIKIDQTDIVRNNTIILREIPDKLNSVHVSDSNGNTLSVIDSGIPDSTKVVVDWTDGILTFADVNNGKTYTISFYGRGSTLIPHSRVYTKTDGNGTVTETLTQVVADAQAKGDALSQTNSDIQTAESNRVSSENTRQSNETTRQSQESTRESNTNSAINRLDTAVGNLKMDFQQPVATFNDISTTYTSPQQGWTVQALDTGNFYRYDGSTWKYIQQINNTQINDLQNNMGLLTNLQTTEKGTIVGALNEIKLKISDTAPTDSSVFWLDTSVL